MFKVNENFPKIFVELTLGLCDILESSIFSGTHIIHFIVITYGMKYVPKCDVTKILFLEYCNFGLKFSKSCLK